MPRTKTTTINQPINRNQYSCLKAIFAWATVLVLFFNLTSCSSIYDETIEIETGNWSENNPISFEFNIQDTTKLYDIFLEVNHQINYSHQNVYCLVESYAPGGLAQRQQSSLELADKKGNWLGDCNNEDCTRKIPFIINTKFDAMGLYKIILTQYTRKANLEGINSLRLSISESTT